MPVHDWSKVDASIFNHFHLCWIGEIARSLNRGSLPPDYYAIIERQTSQFGPIVFTLSPRLSKKRTEMTAQTPGQKSDDAAVVAVRHVGDDRLFAIAEIVVPENKSSQALFRKFVARAVQSLSQDIHLLIVDLLPSTHRDPNGIHGAIWEASPTRNSRLRPDSR